jgi:hypothetical protein
VERHCAILAAYAPKDPRLDKFRRAPASLHEGYVRRTFVPRKVRAPSARCQSPRPEAELPRLVLERAGVYALDDPAKADVELAVFDCSGERPRGFINDKAKKITVLATWMLGILAAVFEGQNATP